MRVHELAKELGQTSKNLIKEIKGLGGAVKNHMSQVDDDLTEQLRKAIKAQEASETKPAKKVATKAKPAKAKAKAQPKAPAKPAAKPKSEPPNVEAPAPEPTPVVAVAPKPAAKKEGSSIQVRYPITVGSLAGFLKVSVPSLIKSLMGLGIFANVNQFLNEEIVSAIAEKLEVTIEKEEDEIDKVLKSDENETEASLKKRPPVVTMMGHVDHGKTSLLDAIRKTNVAKGETGAITQHIGAYVVDLPGKGHVTFLDTPGHAAFTAMRARGATVTDVVVLVIAADDGVMPQTVEAYDHAKEAGCPMVVAVNKVDLPAANLQKVKQQCQAMGLVPEDWGGKTVFVEVSAKSGKGIDELLELLSLESDLLELRANPNRHAVGTVVEAHLSKGSGPLATVIVQRGTLKITDMLVCGSYMGRVRALRNDRGRNLKEAGPSFSAEIVGLNGVPVAGETFVVVEDEKTARKITQKRELEKREREMSGAAKHLSLQDLYHRISEGNFKELKMIVKADVQGSLEALTTSLEKLSTDECRVHVIHAGTGAINESDVMLAAASDAVITGFHVKPNSQAEAMAGREGVELRLYSIIYKATEDVRQAMEGILEPSYKEVIEGRANIRKLFKSSRVGIIGGAMVVKGKILRGNEARILRNNVVVHEGKLAALKRFKDDVREVAQGYECGLSFHGFNDLQEGDLIESYRLEKVASKLSS